MTAETEKVSCQIIPSGYFVKPGYTINTRYYDWRMQQSLNEDRRQNQKELLPLIDLKEEHRRVLHRPGPEGISWVLQLADGD